MATPTTTLGVTTTLGMEPGPGVARLAVNPSPIRRPPGRAAEPGSSQTPGRGPAHRGHGGRSSHAVRHARSGRRVPPAERAVSGQALVSPGGLWSGGVLQVGTILTVPLALGVLALAFVIVQWLVGRRDPKFDEAPAREEDDTVGFE
ncbi:MAG: hypothetical protein ACRDZX_13745 [Acidimicrobiales bacterium]